MTTEFQNRIMKEVFVDTKKYRYTTKVLEYHDGENFVRELAFIRLPIIALDTAEAYDEWEVVKKIKIE